MPPLSLLHLLLVVALLLLSSTAAKLVLYDNTRPMLDTEGRILDAHDGTIQRFQDDGPYYMHAVEYGLCQVSVWGVGVKRRSPRAANSKARKGLGEVEVFHPTLFTPTHPPTRPPTPSPTPHRHQT